MIKVYVTKDQDFASSRAKYISPTITVQNLLGCLCKEYFFPPHNATIYRKTQDHAFIELSNKKATLKELDIGEGSFLTLSRSLDSIFGFPSVSRNQESANIENLPTDEDEDRPLRPQYNQDSDFGGNYSTNSRDSTDSAKLSTGSF